MVVLGPVGLKTPVVPAKCPPPHELPPFVSRRLVHMPFNPCLEQNFVLPGTGKAAGAWGKTANLSQVNLQLN